ncbi:GNAT family N-acetyltransferase [Aquirufa ecclesiirivi]|uniref:GNAT family N-acetyltransferase n=1 Tax=Aquirufa ecclesiirivi TaxID=2715124 RepID=UPI0023D7E6E6|nr:GNAT family N-acetyltransferase [Aquirufa ecclesiirivi]MDF0692775.1 GNAT family N-acetyltransferase [Aquirufa ecclesiirivi]
MGVKILRSQRLYVKDLSLKDAPFLLELLNTPGFMEFIGDRGVRSWEEAKAFCTKLRNNPAIHYRVVFLQSSDIPLGIISLVQRDYLPQPDIGFAFLPTYSGMGYAYEAASLVLDDYFVNHKAPIFATTLEHNVRSIKLLLRLDLTFERSIERDQQQLLVYKKDPWNH